MKRQIIFRGKLIYNGEWIEGDLSHDVITGKIYISRQDGYPPTWNDPGGCYIYVCVEVHPETVGQYTGLKEKNGKMIFEGDKLCNGLIVEWGEFNNCGCCYDVKGVGFNFEDRCFDGKNHEITGNIHDNG